MEKKTVYRFNPKGEEDPSIHYVSEALNRLKSFHLMDEFDLKALARITKYDWFEAEDINRVVNAMDRIADHVDKLEHYSDRRESLLQAADNCRECAIRLKTDFLNGIFGQFA